MRRFVVLAAIAALTFASGVALRAAAHIPAWAYAIVPPPQPGPPAVAAPPADTSLHSLPGSTRQFTRAQVADRITPADWFPDDHPVMPDVVAHGKRPDGRACALCHYPNGKGRPENASVSGLPVSYFIQQLQDFRSGLRKSGEPRKANTNIMIDLAKAMTPEEMRQAAEYFGAIKWTPWIRVIETNTVPKVESHGGIWFPVEGAGAGKEPIGVRVIEVPENGEETEALKNPRSGFIAYVPVGSLKKGEALVMKGGNGRTLECTQCHGTDLLGLGPVPGIAGRSASYLARELYDMQAGTRNGEWTQLMKPVVAKLTDEDIVNITAYLASRPVNGTPAATR